MDSQEVDRFIEETKLWLQQNTPLKEPGEQFWVDHDGNLLKVPEGMWFDAKADTLKFKK
jgi:hypothetical protein